MTKKELRQVYKSSALNALLQVASRGDSLSYTVNLACTAADLMMAEEEHDLSTSYLAKLQQDLAALRRLNTTNEGSLIELNSLYEEQEKELLACRDKVRHLQQALDSRGKSSWKPSPTVTP